MTTFPFASNDSYFALPGHIDLNGVMDGEPGFYSMLMFDQNVHSAQLRENPLDNIHPLEPNMIGQ
jgi:hypothetical protein